MSPPVFTFASRGILNSAVPLDISFLTFFCLASRTCGLTSVSTACCSGNGATGGGGGGGGGSGGGGGGGGGGDGGGSGDGDGDGGGGGGGGGGSFLGGHARRTASYDG